MDDQNKPLAPWTASRSAKEKNVVQRAVTALLDQLAPERVLKRGDQHVIVWSGTVSRRGRAANPEGAKILKELVLLPIEAPLTDYVWRAADGTEYDTATLAAHCIALLEEQI